MEEQEDIIILTRIGETISVVDQMELMREMANGGAGGKNCAGFAGSVYIEYGKNTDTKVIYTSAGTYTWTVPEGITTIKVTVAGAGGGAGGNCYELSGGTGGNGALVTQTLSVTSNKSYAVVVGDGGTKGIDIRTTTGSGPKGGTGGTSSFDSVEAAGGNGGTGGYYYSDPDFGDTKRNGTNGANAGNGQRRCWWK